MEYDGAIIGVTKETIGDLEDVITKVRWSITGTHKGKSHTITGVLDLEPPNSDNFTDLSELTESDIRYGWMRTPEFHYTTLEAQAEIEYEVGYKEKNDVALQFVDVPWD